MAIKDIFKKSILNLFFSLTSVSLIIIFITAFFIFRHESKSSINSLQSAEKNKLLLQENEIIDDFKFIQRDLLFLRDLTATKGVCPCSDETGFGMLEKEFTKFLAQEKQYDQLRLIDTAGMERIRVQNYGQNTVLIDRESLQDKSDRYYYQDIKNLNEHDIYFSKFDLNIENEQIEIPYKPVVRVGMQVPDCEGDPCWIIIINYLGKDLINKLQSLNLNNPSVIHLLDPDGYFLDSPNEENNWGFIFEDKQDKIYANTYPEAWEIIQSQDEGQYKNRDGLFTFQTLTFYQYTSEEDLSDLNYYSKDNYWKVISFVPVEELENINLQIISKFYFPLTLIIILSFIFSWIIAFYRVKEKDAKREIFAKNEFLSNVIDSISDPFYVLCPYGSNIFLANKAANDFGIHEGGLFKDNSMITLSEDREKINAMRQLVVQSGKPQKLELQVKQSNDKHVFYEINGYPVFDQSTNLNKIIEVIYNKTAEKNSEIKFKNLLASAPDGIIITNRYGDIEIVNKQAENLFKYTAEELVGKKIEMLIPERFAKHVDLRSEYIKDPHPRKMGASMELYGLKSTGEEFPTEISLSPIQTSEGLLFSSAIRDISDRKRDEKEINKLALVARNTNNAVIITDFEGKVEWVNNAFETLTEYSLDEVTGKKLGSLLQGDETSQETKDKLSSAIANKQTIKAEIINYSKSGKKYWQSLSIQPILGQNESESKFIGLGIDITSLKQKEQEILKLNEDLEERVKDRTIKLENANKEILKNGEELKKSNLRLELAFSGGGLAWWEWNYETGELFSSPLKYEMLGYKLKEIKQHIDWWTDQMHPDDRENAMRNIQDYLTGKTSSYDFIYRLKHKDNSYVWVHDKGRIIAFTPDNKPLKLIGTIQDITLLKKAEEEIINAKNAAEEANRAKSEFLANMSHEIRTPMNSIIGFSEQLSNTIKEDKQLSQINTIRSSGKNLLRIINDILDLSKIEAGKINIDPLPVSLNVLTSEIEDMFSQKIREKGINMRVELSKEMPKAVLLDEVRVRQILFNLIGNAVKFTDEGSVTLRVDVSKNAVNEKNVDLTIFVKDTGIGIPADQQELIFDPFSQRSGQSVIKYGGTGLGLSITRKLVEKMGGTISVESEPGKGSTFRIAIANIPVVDIDIDIKSKAFDTSQVVFDPATVLIVDDNPENRKLIIDLLESSSLTLIESSNGKEAVDMAREHHPDIILMDLLMPVMDGYQAAEILKKDKHTKAIPIMALTASFKKLEDGANGKKLFDEFLLKPVDISEFFLKIEKYLTYKIKDSDDGLPVKIADTSAYKLTEEQKDELSGFIVTLESKFIPEYEKAIKSNVINEIEIFGKNLCEFSKEKGYQILIDYCNEIATYVDSFEFEKLIKTLKKFPVLIETLKAEI